MSKLNYNKKYFNNIKHIPFSNLKKRIIKLLSKLPLFSTYYYKLINLVYSLPKNAKVLDIGCAQGSTLNFIHNLRPDLKLCGLDFSDVKELLPRYVTFIKSNIIKDEIKEKNFDFIISRHLIEHLQVNDVPNVFKKSYDLLNKKGKLFILAPALSNHFYNDPSHIRPYNKESLRRLFLLFGFKNIKTFNNCEFNFPFYIFKKGMKFTFGFGTK